MCSVMQVFRQLTEICQRQGEEELFYQLANLTEYLEITDIERTTSYTSEWGLLREALLYHGPWLKWSPCRVEKLVS